MNTDVAVWCQLKRPQRDFNIEAGIFWMAFEDTKQFVQQSSFFTISISFQIGAETGAVTSKRSMRARWKRLAVKGRHIQTETIWFNKVH